MINFDSDKLVIVCFPAGGGGKFLVNALGLSDRCLFQNADLAEQQFHDKFTPQDKLNYLLVRLDSVSEKWDDIDLHSPYLFGINAIEHVGQSRETVVYNPIIEKITHINQHYFFIVAHDLDWTRACLGIWPNAKTILFENYEEFILSRNLKIDNTAEMIDNWKQIRGIDWPVDAPMSLKELDALPEIVRKEAVESFHYDNFFKTPPFVLERFAEFKQSSLEFKKTNNTISWDVRNYQSAENTVKQLDSLYTTLGLTDFNAQAIKQYYQMWTSKLKIPIHILEQRYQS
jgi:hypothetical protein